MLEKATHRANITKEMGLNKFMNVICMYITPDLLKAAASYAARDESLSLFSKFRK